MTFPINDMTQAQSADEQLRLIKQSLRAMMNGVASKKMREAGMTYKVNYGVELPRLMEFAKDFPADASLAAALWSEDIRECRLLATMLMPADAFTEALADEWIGQIRFTEEADCIVMRLIAQQPYASGLSFRCMAADEPLRRYAGYQILNRLLMRGMKPTTRDAQEMLDNIASELQSSNSSIRRAVMNVLSRYMDCGIGEKRMAEAMLKKLQQR